MCGYRCAMARLSEDKEQLCGSVFSPSVLWVTIVASASARWAILLFIMKQHDGRGAWTSDFRSRVRELVILYPVLPTSALSEQMPIYMLGPGNVVKIQNPCPHK